MSENHQMMAVVHRIAAIRRLMDEASTKIE